MMKSMITENGLTFKELEKNIYSWICQIGRDFTKEFLERYDRMLMEERDKSKYRHKSIHAVRPANDYGGNGAGDALQMGRNTNKCEKT